MSFRKKLVSAMPLLCIIIFFIIGISSHTWHPTWLIFLLIPMSPSLLGLRPIRDSYAIIIVAAFLLTGFYGDSWNWNWLLFLTIPLFYIFFPKKKNREIPQPKHKFKYNKKIIIDDSEEVNYFYHGD